MRTCTAASIVTICILSSGADGQTEIDPDPFGFDGFNINDSNPPTGVPLDPQVAVSTDWVVTIANSSIRVYDRADSFNIEEEATLSDFEANGFDVRVLFDHNENRFIAGWIGPGKVIFGYTTGSFAVPLVDDGPTQSVWRFSDSSGTTLDVDCLNPPDEDLVVDQPDLGYDHQAWYLAAPLGELNPDGADRFTNAIYILEKTDQNDQAITKVLTKDFVNGSTTLGCVEESDGLEAPRAAQSAIGSPPAAYFVSAVSEAGGGCTGDQPKHLRIYTIGDPLDHSPSDGDLELKYFELDVGCYDPSQVSVPYGDGDETILALDGRITNCHWRDVDGDELLYVSHAVNEPVTLTGGTFDKRVVRWYLIETNGWPDGTNTPTLFDSGTLAGGTVGSGAAERPVHRFMPAIMANGAGAVAVVFHESSAEDPISLRAAGRQKTDDPGTMSDPVEIKVGTAVFPSSSNRWGDYTEIVHAERQPTVLGHRRVRR